MRRLKRLLRQKRTRQLERAFVAEGGNLVGAALDAGATIEAVYYAPSALGAPAASALLERARAAGVRVFLLADGVMERTADTVTPQPVCAVVGASEVTLESLAAADSLVVGLDVRDPGNLGAIIRSAAASGIGGVVCAAGSADPYNPKTVRASAGSIFHVPVAVAEDGAAALAAIKAAGFTLVGAVAHGGRDYAAAPLTGRVAIVLGNEAHGLGREALDELDERLSIPTAPTVESLNVAMAATVLCFELARRRRVTPEK